jgi:hypothetical protein
MPVTLNDEKLIDELSKVADTVEVRTPTGRCLGLFVPAANRGPVRGHDAFLASYSPEDEGLYDADVGR